MNAIDLISQDLFDKIRSRFSKLEMGDEDGNTTSDPQNARFFDFNFTIEGNNLGRVSISINERGALKVFYGQSILESSDPFTQKIWYDFLREMRNFAKRRLLRFDTRDITKSNLNKEDFQYLASVGTKEENMSENKMFGSTKSSYLPLEKTRLIIRHNKSVDEEIRGARSRNIEALYVENSEGERYKYPFIHIAGAKAMQRHVANGGRPYDDCGKAIIKMSEDIAQLRALQRHAGKHRDTMQAEASEMLGRASTKLENLRQHVSNLSKQRHYETWKESMAHITSGDSVVLDQATMEDYKNKFTVSTFQEDLTQFFPLIHSIMQETGEIDLDNHIGENSKEKCEACNEDPCECNNEGIETVKPFEEWVESVIEGKIPDDILQSLKQLIDNDLTLGVDGVSAVEALQGIGITDSDLDSALEQLSKIDPTADPKPTIFAWLNKKDPDAAKQLGFKEPGSEEPGSEEPVVGDKKPEDEEGGENDEQLVEKPTLLDIAELVKSHYNKEDNTFPLGETGVVTKVRKELGDWAGDLAERLVHSLKEKQNEIHAPRGPEDNVDHDQDDPDQYGRLQPDEDGDVETVPDMDESNASDAELARMAHKAYCAAIANGNHVMARHYKEKYEMHKEKSKRAKSEPSEEMDESPIDPMNATDEEMARSAHKSYCDAVATGDHVLARHHKGKYELHKDRARRAKESMGEGSNHSKKQPWDPVKGSTGKRKQKAEFDKTIVGKKDYIKNWKQKEKAAAAAKIGAKKEGTNEVSSHKKEVEKKRQEYNRQQDQKQRERDKTEKFHYGNATVNKGAKKEGIDDKKKDNEKYDKATTATGSVDQLVSKNSANKKERKKADLKYDQDTSATGSSGWNEDKTFQDILKLSGIKK
jgi:hypothetical protein